MDKCPNSEYKDDRHAWTTVLSSANTGLMLQVCWRCRQVRVKQLVHHGGHGGSSWEVIGTAELKP